MKKKRIRNTRNVLLIAIFVVVGVLAFYISTQKAQDEVVFKLEVTPKTSPSYEGEEFQNNLVTLYKDDKNTYHAYQLESLYVLLDGTRYTVAEVLREGKLTIDQIMNQMTCPAENSSDEILCTYNGIGAIGQDPFDLKKCPNSYIFGPSGVVFPENVCSK